MTLNEIIAAKPRELRLGQYFVNLYWKGSDQQSRKLFYLMSDTLALWEIRMLLRGWQWDENNMPEGRIV